MYVYMYVCVSSGVFNDTPNSGASQLPPEFYPSSYLNNEVSGKREKKHYLNRDLRLKSRAIEVIQCLRCH